SEVIAKAVTLNALLEANPDLPAVDKLAADLLRNTDVHGHWGTTHDNAQALVALGKYFKHHGQEESDFSGTLIAGGESVKFSSDEKSSINIGGNVDNFQIKSEGEGTIHLSIKGEGIPKPEDRSDIERGMSVHHEIYNLNGEKVEGRTFQQGTLYVLESTVEIDPEKDNIFMQDIIPGGFQLENQRMATRTSKVPFLEKNVIDPDYTDIRDDRIIVFFDADDYNQDHYSYKYLVRAVNPGEFTYPALSAGNMYDPDMKAVKQLKPISVKQ
ncbi:MAG: hypothetical protein ABEJ65_11990, partial [bacterium]